jgi:pSer/pThr/pTyr-binding forkhead associated (FHA) protein
VRVDQPNFTIGRAVSNDLILQDAKVSRQHAVLRYLGGSWQIEDSNSTGGVFVNDHRVNRAELGNGDYIRIGGNVFIFREG